MTDLPTSLPAGLGLDPNLAAAATVTHGALRRGLRRFRRDKVAVVAFVWLVVMAIVAIISLFWTPHPPNETFIADPFLKPFQGGTILGTDDLGRDILSRMMVGARVSLRFSLLVVGASLLVSVPLGLFAGYRGGYIDTLIMRVLDAITSVPGIMVALAIVAVLGPGLNNVMVALIIVSIPGFVRLVRAQALSVSAEPYIMASRSVGSSTPWILLRRVFPGVLPALSVTVSLSLGGILTAEAALSFLGIGVLPPNASWGGVLSRAYGHILRAPGGLIAPMFAIGTVVLSFNLVGDGIRDSLGVGASRKSRRRSHLGLTTVRRTPVTTGTSTPAPVASMSTARARLVVRDLCVDFEADSGTLHALDHVSLEVGAGEILGIVGESGSGKTVTAMSIMRLLTSPPGVITGGSVVFDGTELLDLDMIELRKVRGAGISMVFQNPMTSLDPVFTIGNSLREAIQNHEKLGRKAADARAIELLDMVGIPAAASRLADYPHNFSGGMRQRAMIAMALAGRPKLLIADEPTTALDVTIQAQILSLIASLRTELDMSVILVTHDLGVVAQICDRVAVMYAGHIVETAPVENLFAKPVHPYTAGLLSAVPSAAQGQQRLRSLPGSVPQLTNLPPGCRFAPRCPFVEQRCTEVVPQPEMVRGHEVRCIRAGELHLDGRIPSGATGTATT
jgi:peptide/nickel transport system permease protein